MGVAKFKKIERLIMIEPATKVVSRLQTIRDRVAAQAANKATKQAVKPAAPRTEEPNNRGLAEALVTILVARGFRLTATQKRRILACTDSTQIEGWIARAATAKSATSVLSR